MKPNSRLIFLSLTVGLVSLLIHFIPVQEKSLFPPENDACSTPSIIEISQDNYAYGTFQSATIDISQASVEAGEHFEFSDLSSRSIWYSFELPTSRQVKIEVFQVGSMIAITDLGFTTYLSDACLPAAPEVIAAKLAPINKFGSTENPCLDPGKYLIQIHGKANIVGEVYLTLTTMAPNAGTILSPHDLPTGAYDFGLQDRDNRLDRHDDNIQCYSIDNVVEGDCLNENTPGLFAQSAWYTFTTDNYIDLLSIYLQENISNFVLPNSIGYRIYEGDVRLNDPIDLAVIAECLLFNIKDSNEQVMEQACTLKANTTYSFVLLFPEGFEIDPLQIRIGHRGTQATAAPRPLSTEVNASPNQLGVLPHSMDGETTTLRDWFSCNAFLAQNPCGLVNPATGVFHSEEEITYDMALWGELELATHSNVRFSFDGYKDYRYVRIFSKGLTANCSDIDPLADLYASFTDASINLNCMPPGKYSIQVLAASSYPFPVEEERYQPQWEEGNLGREMELEIRVTTTILNNHFSLNEPHLVDSINGNQDLVSGTYYFAQADTFGCNNTVLPIGGSCEERTKATYDILRIGDGDGDMVLDSGYLSILSLWTNAPFNNPTNYDPDIHYKLYNNNLSEQLIIENTIQGASDYLGFCIQDTDDFWDPGIDSFCVCVTPGSFTLAGFGDSRHVNLIDQGIQYQFNQKKTKYYTRASAENLGDITNQSSLTSTVDYFSCLDNSAILGGLVPCNNATKIIYRQFYLSTPKSVQISRLSGTTGNYRLYSGQANNPSTELIPYSGLNFSGNEWSSCFTAQRTSDCFPLAAGWYTLVTYGKGASYEQPAYNNVGDRVDVGKPTQVQINITDPITSKYNRPHKAYNAGLTDWNTAGQTAACPSSLNRYSLGTEIFTCMPDTPFSSHPIQNCETEYNRVSYYVFSISQPSFIAFEDIPATYITKVFDLDVRRDSLQMISDERIIYPCSSPSFRQLCDLPPGTYTLAIFGNDIHEGEQLTPTIVVQASGISRFDHANHCYDFDVIPQDGIAYTGRVGDIHPENPNLPASQDIIYCSAGAQASDPTEGKCYDVSLNPNIYNPQYPHVLYSDNIPEAGFWGQDYSWRNIWYTFVLKGTGTASIELLCEESTYKYPNMVVYRSDTDGNLSLATLLSSGGIDSTKADGLSFVEGNFLNCSWTEASLTFNKSACESDAIRYYVLITQNETISNQAVALSIAYDPSPNYPIKYDHYSTANQIDGLGTEFPPYGDSLLAEGTHYGASFSLQCAARDEGDPFSSNSYGRSVWYRFETATSGIARIAYQANFPPFERDVPIFRDGMQLYYETEPGDSTSLQEVTLNYYSSFEASNPTGHAWMEACFRPGTYYLFINDYINTSTSTTFDLQSTFKPIVWLTESPGDFCRNAVIVDVPAVGMYSSSLEINCHTIGTDFGEDGSQMGCLPGPTNYKSSWFKIQLSGEDKVDVTFSLSETTNADLENDISYRIFYGNCQVSQAGPCIQRGNTSFTLNCMSAGDYMVQIISPRQAQGEISLQLNAILSADQNCVPSNPLQPIAAFDYTIGCNDISFINRSTFGEDIEYLWLFPNQLSSSLGNPVLLPIPDQETFEVKLIVTNTQSGFSDTLAQELMPPLELAPISLPDTIICSSDSIEVDVSYPGATYEWQDGDTQAIYHISQAGEYWVALRIGECIYRDTFLVTLDTCYLYSNQAISLCQGEAYEGIYYQEDTTLTDTIAIGSLLDSIVTVQVTMIDTFHQAFSINLCEGETYEWNNQQLDRDTNFCQTFTSTIGCDSTVCFEVRIYESITLDTTIRLCQGSTIEIEGDTYDSDITICNDLQTINGCDSTYCTNLIFLDSIQVMESQTICQGSVLITNGENLETAGTYCWDFSSTLGCDSTYCLELTIIEIDTIEQPHILCAGETIMINNSLVSEDSRICFVAPLAEDCAEIQCHTITFRPSLQTEQAVQLCPGETLQVGTGHYNIAGDYTNILTGVNGCDSTIITHLSYEDISPLTITGPAAFCEGERVVLSTSSGFTEYNWSNGQEESSILVDTPGQYSVTATNGGACSAVAHIEVLMSTQIQLELAIADNIDCFDQTGSLTSSLSGGSPPYNYLWNNGSSQPTLSQVSSGNYSLKVTDQFGCEAQEQINLPAATDLSVTLETIAPNCPDEPAGVIKVTAEGGNPPHLYSINEKPFQSGTLFDQLGAGPYEIKVQDIDGCEATANTILEASTPLEISLGDLPEVLFLGEKIQLKPISNLPIDSFQWRLEPAMDVQLTALNVSFQPLQSGAIYFTAYSSSGCKKEIVHRFRVSKRESIYIPNSFSPNNDGINDIFTIYARPGAVKMIKDFKLFDRWGNLVFEANEFAPNGLTGWDGKHKGQLKNAGVFVYYAKIEMIDSQIDVYKGGVMLMR